MPALAKIFLTLRGLKKIEYPHILDPELIRLAIYSAFGRAIRALYGLDLFYKVKLNTLGI